MTGGTVPTVMLVILIVFGTGLVYWVYARAQDLLDVSVLAVLLCSIPVFAVLFAYVLLGEPLTGRLVLGGLVVIAGIVVIAAERGVAPEAAAQLAEEMVLERVGSKRA
jgi:drug/metabolite transporter (DMT)-like permease